MRQKAGASSHVWEQRGRKKTLIITNIMVAESEDQNISYQSPPLGTFLKHTQSTKQGNL
jgi:hypothetical protein